MIGREGIGCLWTGQDLLYSRLPYPPLCHPKPSGLSFLACLFLPLPHWLITMDSRVGVFKIENEVWISGCLTEAERDSLGK